MNKTPDKTTTLTARDNDSGRRLDRILRKHFPAFPLSLISRLLREKKVRVNGAAQGGPYRVMPGDVITVEHAGEAYSAGPPEPGQPRTTSGENHRADSASPRGPLRIVYEDDDLLVADKPRGVLTHGDESLASEVSAYLADKIPASLSFRPGPLHRLDRNTGGLVVFGKSLKGARSFTQATQNGRVKKYYLALADGIIEQEEVWEDYLVRDKKEKKTYPAHAPFSPDPAAPPPPKAVTRVRPLAYKNGTTVSTIATASMVATVIEAEISSGKTHQIRAQCALHGHPLTGDKKYGGVFRQNGYFLYAYKIVIEKDGGTLTVELKEEESGLRLTLIGLS